MTACCFALHPLPAFSSAPRSLTVKVTPSPEATVTTFDSPALAVKATPLDDAATVAARAATGATASSRAIAAAEASHRRRGMPHTRMGQGVAGIG